MKGWLPVLFLFAGLGCSFSFGQPKQVHQFSDPFDRYLMGLRANRSEVALQRFARECSVDTAKSKPKFAVNPGNKWTPVQSLSNGLRNLDSDFYSSAEVWHEENRVLVEIWVISADVGSEVRVYRCFANDNLLQAEAIDWNVPVDGADPQAWGYSRRWERDSNGRMRRTKAEFVNEIERPIPKPRLDADGERSLIWEPGFGSLGDMKLPLSMLR
jgi:hypothetical protein